MIRRPPRSTQGVSSAASDVYKRQVSTQSTWETGYTGKIVKKEIVPHILTYTDPWKSNDNNVVVLAEIDLDSPENLTPHQNLEGDEEIEVVLLSYDNFFEEVQRLVKERKCLLDGQVWMFALGRQMAKSMPIKQPNQT
eukprot:TRINITY_DN12619_c0_g1_i5.p2 TRINITY_DN12619_c0_g1~~TRINITY_DN12619_c0_g1_i5.p2  ORF type:complete len:138 (-),score=36.36 TRINITY_DN12619_c0_g1_i5:28-441(-)